MALREVLADLSVRVSGVQQLAQANRGVDRAVVGLRNVGQRLGAIGAAISSALAVREVGALVHQVIVLGDEIGDTSQRMGVSAAALQRWRFIAERSGVETAELDGALRGFNRTLGQASRGGAAAAGF